MEKILDSLVERLRKALGADLVSVVLYGSAAAGDLQGRFSDYNVMCVLHEVTPRELAAFEPVVRWWHDLGNPSPLLLSEKELVNSTDCFPIEFHDIVRQHRILFGADVVENLEIDDSFYRAEVEYELRGKLLRLRQKAASVLSEPDLLRKLLADSLSTFCVLFRHALRLHGVEGGMKKREVIAGAMERFGIDPAPFLTLLDLREERVKPKTVDPGPLLASYLREISVVVDAVDGLDK